MRVKQIIIIKWNKKMEGLSHDAGHCLGVRDCLGDYLVVRVIVLGSEIVWGTILW